MLQAEYDGSYVENHCNECGEYESECSCDSRCERDGARTVQQDCEANDHRSPVGDPAGSWHLPLHQSKAAQDFFADHAPPGLLARSDTDRRR